MAYSSAFAGFGHSGDNLTLKTVPSGMCLVMAAECGYSTKIGIHVRALYNLFCNRDPTISRWIHNPRLYKTSLEANLGFRIRIYEEGDNAPNFSLHLFMASDNHDGTALMCKSGVYSYPAPDVQFLLGQGLINTNMISSAYADSLVPTQTEALAQMKTNPADYSDFYWNIVDNHPYTFDTAMAQGGWFGGRTVFYNFSCRSLLPLRRIPARQEERLLAQRRATSGQQQEDGIFRAGPAAGLRARRAAPREEAPMREYEEPTARERLIQTLRRDHPDWTHEQTIQAVNAAFTTRRGEGNTICDFITGVCINVLDGVISQFTSRRGGRRTRRHKSKKNKTRINKHKRSTKTRRA